MKPKNLLIAICLVLMLCPIGLAQNVFNFSSAGFSMDMDGNVSNVAQTGVATFITKNAYVVGSAQYSRAINESGEDYGLEGTYGYILSKFFTVTGSLSGIKSETNEGAIGYAVITGSLTLFPWGNLLDSGTERVGGTLGFAYKPGTRDLTGSLQITTFFGK
jgi:hypothetical protein